MRHIHIESNAAFLCLKNGKDLKRGRDVSKNNKNKINEKMTASAMNGLAPCKVKTRRWPFQVRGID